MIVTVLVNETILFFRLGKDIFYTYKIYFCASLELPEFLSQNITILYDVMYTEI